MGSNQGASPHQVMCSWCGTTIRMNATKDTEQMCLICYARMLNENFHKIRTRREEGGHGGSGAAS